VALLGAVLSFAADARAQSPAPALPDVAKLGSDSIDERRGAAKALSSLGSREPQGAYPTDAIARELGELRRSEDTRTTESLGQLPLRAGSDADVIELLVRLAPDGVVEKALATVCLMRALTRIGTTPSVRQLVRVAFDAGGLFRPVLVRDLRELDDRATAALVEAGGEASPDVRAWAKDALEGLGKRTPGDAVQTTDDQVLVDVLGAFATIRDLDAVPVVVSFVNSDRTPVRNAAREATLAYGPDAAGKVRSTYAALTGQRLPDTMDARSAALALFETYDHHRLRDVYARLDEGLARQRAGDIDGAVAAFEDVLARQPELDRAPEAVPALVTYAAGIEDADRPRAVDVLRTALRLGRGATQDQIRSEMRYLEGEELASRGLADTTPYEQALDLYPDNERARARLAGLRADAAGRRRREGYVAAAVGAAGVALVAIGLLGLLRRGRPGRGRAGGA
jgi:tetratricopeptide (TPR) repeat protein